MSDFIFSGITIAVQNGAYFEIEKVILQNRAEVWKLVMQLILIPTLRRVVEVFLMKIIQINRCLLFNG